MHDVIVGSDFNSFGADIPHMEKSGGWFTPAETEN